MSQGFRPVLLMVSGTLLAGGLLLVGERQMERLPTFCGTCHSAAYRDWKTSGAALNHSTCVECHADARAQVPNENCATCHDDKALLQQRHHALVPTRSSATFCNSCHVAEVIAAEAEDRPASSLDRECSICHNHSVLFKGEVSSSTGNGTLKARSP